MTHLAANAANALSSGKISYKRDGAGRESKNDAMPNADALIQQQLQKCTLKLPSSP